MHSSSFQCTCRKHHLTCHEHTRSSVRKHSIFCQDHFASFHFVLSALHNYTTMITCSLRAQAHLVRSIQKHSLNATYTCTYAENIDTTAGAGSTAAVLRNGKILSLEGTLPKYLSIHQCSKSCKAQRKVYNGMHIAPCCH